MVTGQPVPGAPAAFWLLHLLLEGSLDSNFKCRHPHDI